MIRESGFFPKGAVNENGEEAGRDAEAAKAKGVSPEVAKAFDWTPAPEGPIAGDLGELDQMMQEKAIEDARAAVEAAAALEQPADFDASPAPEGPIKDAGLAEMDRMLGGEEASDDIKRAA